jgi:CHAD domain-containing protein
MPVTQERIPLIFQKLEKDLIKLSCKQTADSVHNFRTSASRVQTLFEYLLPQPNRNQKKLLKLLSRMRKRAGRIRDLDVQLAALRSLKVSQQPRRKTQLTQALIELREGNETKLSRALTKEVVRDIRRRLRRALKDSRLTEIQDPLQVARQLLSQIEAPDGPLSEEVLHQRRIVTKRARYVAEFAPQSLEADRLIAELRRAQDVLGDWHDWLTLTQSATQYLGDIHQSPLVAVLHNLTATKFRKAVTALPESVKVNPTAKPMRSSRREPSTPETAPTALRSDSAA